MLSLRLCCCSSRALTACRFDCNWSGRRPAFSILNLAISPSSRSRFLQFRHVLRGLRPGRDTIPAELTEHTSSRVLTPTVGALHREYGSSIWGAAHGAHILLLKPELTAAGQTTTRPCGYPDSDLSR